MAAKSGASRAQVIRDHLEKARESAASQGFLRLAGAVRGPKDLSTRKGFHRP